MSIYLEYLEQQGQIHFRGSWRDLQKFLASLSTWENSIGITWSKFAPSKRPFHPGVVGDYFICVHSVGGGKPDASVLNSFIQSYLGHKRPYSEYKRKSQVAAPRRRHARKQVKPKRATPPTPTKTESKIAKPYRKRGRQVQPRATNAGCLGLLIQLILGSQK